MTTIVTRSGKGSSLSWSEADSNFTNLNTDKLETTSVGVSVQAYSSNLDTFATVSPTAAGLALLDDIDVTAQRVTLGLGNVDNTSDATKNAASVILTNKTITTPVINTNINFSGTSGAIQVNGVDKVTIPTTGAVKIPGNVIAFSVYPAGAQGFSAATSQIITYDTEEFDIGGFYDTALNRFKPMVAGYYFIEATVSQSGTGATYIYISKTGSEFKRGAQMTSPVGLSVSTIVFLDGVNDYIQAGLWSASGGAGNTPARALTHMSGHLLGAT